MTCEIKSLDAGSLQVSLDYVDGTISVQWSRVQRLDSKRLFIVTLEDGSVYSGTLSIAEAAPDEPTKLQISSGPGSFVLIDKKRIVNMGETSEDFWQRFAVDLQSGIIYSQGQLSPPSTTSVPRSPMRGRAGRPASTSTPRSPRARAPTPPPATSSTSTPITCCPGRTTSTPGRSASCRARSRASTCAPT